MNPCGHQDLSRRVFAPAMSRWRDPRSLALGRRAGPGGMRRRETRRRSKQRGRKGIRLEGPTVRGADPDRIRPAPSFIRLELTRLHRLKRLRGGRHSDRTRPQRLSPVIAVNGPVDDDLLLSTKSQPASSRSARIMRRPLDTTMGSPSLLPAVDRALHPDLLQVMPAPGAAVRTYGVITGGKDEPPLPLPGCGGVLPNHNPR